MKEDIVGRGIPIERIKKMKIGKLRAIYIKQGVDFQAYKKWLKKK